MCMTFGGVSSCIYDNLVETGVSEFMTIVLFSVTSQLTSVGLAAGDSVMISGESHPLLALAMGYVNDVTDDTIAVLCDR